MLTQNGEMYDEYQPDPSYAQRGDYAHEPARPIARPYAAMASTERVPDIRVRDGVVQVDGYDGYPQVRYAAARPAGAAAVCSVGLDRPLIDVSQRFLDEVRRSDESEQFRDKAREEAAKATILNAFPYSVGNPDIIERFFDDVDEQASTMARELGLIGCNARYIRARVDMFYEQAQGVAVRTDAELAANYGD